VGTISKLNFVPKVVLSAAEAQSKIRSISFESEDVIFTNHALERIEQRGISIPDVLEILRGGYVDDPPSEDFAGDWKCKVTSRLRGRTAGVVTVIVDSKRQLVIVTVEWEDFT
jgi:Domain of unknown function (DUF4258)